MVNVAERTLKEVDAVPLAGGAGHLSSAPGEQHIAANSWPADAKSPVLLATNRGRYGDQGGDLPACHGDAYRKILGHFAEIVPVSALKLGTEHWTRFMDSAVQMSAVRAADSTTRIR